MPHRILSLSEVAEFLHLKPGDVETLVQRHEIPCERKGGRVTFRRKEIEEWASARLLGFTGAQLDDFHKTASTKARDLSSTHAIIPALMDPSYIQPVLPSKTKASVLRQMVDLAESTNLLYQPDDLLASLVARERMCSTALGGGVAFLHPRNQEPFMFGDSFIVLGRTAQGIPFSAPDGERTWLFFLVCCQEDRLHLHVLARLCMLCSHTPLLAELEQAAHAREMYEKLTAAEAEIIRGL